MNTVNQPRSMKLSLRALLRKSVNKCLSVIVPNHVKRIMFILSVFRAYGHANGYDITDVDRLALIDTRFRLVGTSDARSLVWPAYFSKWTVRRSNLDYYTKMLYVPRSELYTMIYGSNSWLNWGRTSDIVNEVMRIRRFITHPTTQVALSK